VFLAELSSSYWPNPACADCLLMSKNAHRVQCSECTVFVPAGASVCDVCGLDLQRAARHPAVFAPVDGASQPQQKQAGTAATQCPLCTTARLKNASLCGFCGYKFLDAAARKPWTCGECTVRNEAEATVCSVCTAAPPAWKCVACTLRNDAMADVCSTCQTPRPAATDVVFQVEIPLRILATEGPTDDHMRAQVRSSRLQCV
jgi:predicted amidophosphoribosyltransferase